MQFNSRVLLQVKLNSSKMFSHERKLISFPVKTFLKNSAYIITAFKTGFTVFAVGVWGCRFMYFGLGTGFGDKQSWILYLHNNKTFLLKHLRAAHSHCMSIEH